MTVILGLNAFHGDAAACLVVNGKLVAAVEEERLRRLKHWAGFPSQAIKSCLQIAGLTLADVDHLALNRNPRANVWRKLGFVLCHRPDFAAIRRRISNAGAVGAGVRFS